MAKTRARGNVPKRTVVAQRLNRVYELARDGYRFTKVRAIVALEAQKEAADRKAAKADKDKPPECWGDSGRVAERTLVRYWKRAHTRLIEDGKKLVKQGDLILSKNFSRQDALYVKAYDMGRLEVCRKIIVDQLTLFGLWDVIKVQLSSALDQGAGGEAPDIAPVQSERTLPELIDAQFAIFNAARARNGLAPLPNPGKLHVVAGGKR